MMIELSTHNFNLSSAEFTIELNVYTPFAGAFRNPAHRTANKFPDRDIALSPGHVVMPFAPELSSPLKSKVGSTATLKGVCKAHLERSAPLEPTSDSHQELDCLGAVPKNVSKVFENCMLAINCTPWQPVDTRVQVADAAVPPPPEKLIVGAVV
jgi:hypothetical protein